jgi:multiple sugar transport system substrate-binding protein
MTVADEDILVLPRGCPHPKEAFEFIKWETTNPQLAAEFATLVVNLPHLKKVPATPLFKDPNFQVFEREADSPNAHQLPILPISAQFTTNLGNAEQSALLGKSTPQQALSSLQSTTQQELSSTG